METIKLTSTINRGLEWAITMRYEDAAGALVDLTSYTPAVTVVNEFGASVSGFTFEKGTFGTDHLRLSVAEGNTIVGDKLTFTLRLNSSGADVLLGRLIGRVK